MSRLKIVFVIIVSVAMVGVSINAFAHRGMGWGGGWGHHRDGYGPGYGGRADEMSKETFTQMEEKREAFLKATRDIRAALIEKERALQAEMAKEKMDVARASELQKEISQLRGQFDQQRIEHMAEMRKLNPNAGRGYKRGGSNMG